MNIGPWRPSVGILLIVGTAIIWGTTGVAAKEAAARSGLDAVAISWLRSAIAGPICLLLGWRALGRELFAMSRRDAAAMVALGLILLVTQVCYLAGIDRIGVSAATLISLCLPPVMVAAVSVAFLGERLTPRLTGALTGAVVGTALIVGWRHGANGQGRETVIGALLAAASAVGIAIHVVVSRGLAGRHHPLRPLAVTMTSGAVLFAPVALWHGVAWRSSAPAWSLVAYMALGPSLLAYWMYQRGLRDVPATEASIVTLLEPLVAAILAAILFDERLGLVGSVGAMLLVASIALLTLTSGRMPASSGVDPIGEGAL